MSESAHRMSNSLRYRASDDPRQTYMTPEYALGPIRKDLGGWIGLDPCTIAENPTGASMFYTLEEDGLAQPWSSMSIFCNPPYGKAREPWVERCIEAAKTGSKVVLLIPAATDTRIWQHAAASASAIASTIFGWNTVLQETGSLGVRWLFHAPLYPAEVAA